MVVIATCGIDGNGDGNNSGW